MAEKSWSVSDKFYEKAGSLGPELEREKAKANQHGKGGGRIPVDFGKLFESIALRYYLF